MANPRKDKFVIAATDDLASTVRGFDESEFRKRFLQRGMRSCKRLVYWRKYLHPIQTVQEEEKLKRMSEEDLKAVITEFNPQWGKLNKGEF